MYQVDKHTTRPGPWAKDVHPAPKGDFYRYSVDKFWRVAAVLENGQLRLVTRRGTEHIVAHDDPRLRKTNCGRDLFTGAGFPNRFRTAQRVRPIKGPQSRTKTLYTMTKIRGDKTPGNRDSTFAKLPAGASVTLGPVSLMAA